MAYGSPYSKFCVATKVCMNKEPSHEYKNIILSFIINFNVYITLDMI